MRWFLLTHPLISLLAYAWIIGAGAMFLPLIDAAYRQWLADRPKRERISAHLRPRVGWRRGV